MVGNGEVRRGSWRWGKHKRLPAGNERKLKSIYVLEADGPHYIFGVSR
jgi:hypothetical protein